MSIEIKVPNLPESVSEATVSTWHIKAGDRVAREQNLVDLETDKVMLEVPSTADGVLVEIRVQAGQTVKAGDVIGVVSEGAAAAAPAAAAKIEIAATTPGANPVSTAADDASCSPNSVCRPARLPAPARVAV